MKPKHKVLESVNIKDINNQYSAGCCYHGGLQLHTTSCRS